MQEGFTRKEKLVGAFLLVLMIFTMVTLLVIAQGKGWFVTQTTYQVKFKQGYNLHPGSLVKMFNAEIGKVSDMRITTTGGQPQVAVTVKVNKEYANLVRQDSVAEVVSPTIIGSEYLEISPGSSGYPKIGAYGTIPSRERQSLTDQLAELVNQETIQKVKFTLANIAQLSEQLKNDEKVFLGVVNHANQVLVSLTEAKGTMGLVAHAKGFICQDGPKFGPPGPVPGGGQGPDGRFPAFRQGPAGFHQIHHPGNRALEGHRGQHQGRQRGLAGPGGGGHRDGPERQGSHGRHQGQSADPPDRPQGRPEPIHPCGTAQPSLAAGLGLGLAALVLGGCAAKQDPFAQQVQRINEVSIQGEQWFSQGDLKRASRDFSRALTMSRSVDYPQGAAQQLNNLGAVALEEGDFKKARDCFTQAYNLNCEQKQWVAASINQANLATVAQKVGNPGEAAQHLQAAQDAAWQAQSTPALARVYLQWASFSLDQNDLATAEDFLNRTQPLATTPELKGTLAHHLGRLALARGDTGQALERFGQALRIDRSILDRACHGRGPVFSGRSVSNPGRPVPGLGLLRPGLRRLCRPGAEVPDAQVL